MSEKTAQMLNQACARLVHLARLVEAAAAIEDYEQAHRHLDEASKQAATVYLDLHRVAPH